MTQPTKSNTPRTDAVIFTTKDSDYNNGPFVDPDFARQLETELQQSLETISKCRNSVVEACLEFPNVGSLIAQQEKELKASIRREVLEKCVIAINGIFRPETKCADYHPNYGHLMGYSFQPNSVIHDRLKESLTLAQQELERTK